MRNPKELYSKIFIGGLVEITQFPDDLCEYFN